jgi:tRNA(Ile)-lysidine synthase
MMKQVLAVSGGVDSVVLLDMIMRGLWPEFAAADFVVAHFDHQIRPESGTDAELVRQLADVYQMEFALGCGGLGADASEDQARRARYRFLRQVAAGGKIITAHHQDDLIETMLINLIRGTGWRGLAPMWAGDVERPLITMSKAELVDYAVRHQLTWVEDATNDSQQYFRNRVRVVAQRMSAEQRRQLLELNHRQTQLRYEIESILRDVSPTLTQDGVAELAPEVAIEILNRLTNGRLTTPQLQRLREFVLGSQSGDLFHAGNKLQAANYRGSISITDLLQ